MADTARLILQVDAAVQLAQSNLRALSNTVEGESKNYDKSVSRMEGAHKRLDLAGNQSRMAMMEMEHVFRSMGDSVSAGQDPLRAFTMELGRVGEAATLMGPSLGKVGAILSGPWGLALTAGIGLLASLGFGHKEASAAAYEHKTTAELLRLALKGDEEAYKALTKAIDEEYKAANQAIRTSEQAAQAAYHEANAQRVAALAVREKTKAHLDAALADEKAALARLKAPEYGAHDANTLGAQADYNFAQARVAKLETQARDANAEYEKAQRATLARAIPIVEERVKRNTDPEAAARGRYDDGIGKLRQQFASGTITADALQKAEEKLTRTRDAELEAIKEANKTQRKGPSAATLERDGETAATRAAYLKRWLEEALPGVRVTATTEHSKYVAGTNRISDHYNGQAIDFVPPGGLGSMTKDQARALFESAGMKIRFNASGVEQLFGPWMGTGTALGRAHQNHIHAGVEGTPPGPGTMAHRMEAAAEKQAREQEAGEQELMRAQEELAKATRARVMTAEETEAFEVGNVDVELRRKESAAQALVTEGKRTQAWADEIIGVYQATASAKRRRAAEDDTAHVIAAEAAHEQTYFTGVVTLLQLQESLAVTTKERKKIALEILDYEERQARAALQKALADEKDPEKRKDIQSRIGQIDQQHGLKVDQINQRNADPLTSYMNQLRANAGDMNEALKNVEVDGLKSLESGILGVISGTESLASAFKKMASSILADLARIAIEKGILSLLEKLHIGGSGGGDITSKVVGGKLGGKFAEGGSPPVGLASLVGERGPELFIPKVPGVVIPNHMLGGRGGDSRIAVEVTPSPYFDVRVTQISGQQLQSVAPALVAGGGAAGQAAMYRQAARRIP